MGRWAVRKILEESLGYVRNNILSQLRQTHAAVRVAHTKSQLLQEWVIVQFANPEGSTTYPETLAVTEDKHYHERGLLHSSDQAFEFFLEEEQMRAHLLLQLQQSGNKGTVIVLY